MKKAIKWTLIIVPLVLIIAVVVVIVKLDGIIRSTVETQATASTRLNTTLGGAHLSLTGGKLKLSDLKIAPPAGFQSPSMFELKGVKVQVSYGELTKTPIRISQIVIDSPKLVIEQSGGKLNVQAAMEGMPPSESSSMRMVIGQIDVKNTQIVVRPGLPMLKPEYNFTLPIITVKDVGTADNAQNGAAVKDVVATLWVAIMEELKKSDQVPDGLKPWLGSSSADLKTQAREQIGSYLQKQFGGNAPTTQDAGKQIQQGLQDLLGGNKKK